ncbi:hypothetical protein ACFLSE_04065 [Bacteroidota bacterium]
MRKNILYNLIGLALLVGSIVSCDTASQDVSPIVAPDDSYPVVTGITLENTGTITEGDVITYTITINKPIDRALKFSAVLDTNLTTLVEHVDFDFTGGTIEAWETETELQIVTIQDVYPESDGVIAFQLTLASLAEMYLVHPDNVMPSASATVANYTSDELFLEFHWDVDVYLPGIGTYPAGANVDWDIFMSPDATYDPNDPWASVDYTYYAATGSEPEEIELTGAADGDYVFWADLWSNGFWGYGATTEIPITTMVMKPGIFVLSIAQDPATIINAGTAGYLEGGAASATCVKVTIAGTTYTVSDYNDVVVGSGKIPSERTPRSFIK